MRAGLGAFLDAVHEEVLPLGTGERLRVMRLYLSRDPARWEEGELQASLASLLAQDPFQWRRIAGLYQRHVTIAADGAAADRYLLGAEAPEEPVLAGTLSSRSSRRAARAQGGLSLRGQRLGLVQRLRRQAPWLRVLALGLLIAAGGGWLVRHLWPALDPPLPPVNTTRQAPPAAITVNKVETVLSFSTVGGPWPKERAVAVPLLVRPPPWRKQLIGGAFVYGLLLLGFRLLLLPRALRTGALRRRQELARRQLAQGLPQRPAYRVPAFAMLPPQAAEDTATLLGRLHRVDVGAELDIGCTVDATARASGLIVPVFAARRSRVTLLVLIDQERGGHPFLEPFRRLLATWRRLGVSLITLRYAHRPTQNLFAEGSDKPVEWAQLLRQHQGAVLLLFSRLRVPVGLRFQAEWLDDLRRFPLRAWLDPDPRGEDERDAEEVRLARRLVQAGMGHFPFSSAGVIALCRYLAADGIGVAAPAWPVLGSLEEPGVRAAVERWAAAAAAVPDATWDQVEEFRRALPDLARDLPDPRYVQRLVELLRERGEGEPEGGDILFIDEAEQDALIAGARAGSAGAPAEGAEGEVRRLLIEQLGTEEPGDELLRWHWRLARARHQAMLEPARAAQLFAPFAGSPVEGEAQQFLRAELERRGAERFLPDTVVGELKAQSGEAGGVPLAAVMVGQLGVWGWAALAAGVAAPVLWLLVMGVGKLRLREEMGTFPEIRKVEICERSRVAATEARAEMVEICPGTFMMGSPKEEEGRDDDEDQHEVKLTRRFLIGVTEVTQGQYLKVIGKNPSESKGDLRRPVESVSWFDAVEYCNALSKREAIGACYQVRRKGKEEAPSVDLIGGCGGYRLPTEAEWEYAARAGQKTLYAGENELDKVAWSWKNSRGWVQPVGKLAANAWGLYDMSGNVLEWVWDWTGSYDKGPVVDPAGLEAGSPRVLRGGSFGSAPRNLRVACRFRYWPGDRYGNLGFRVVRSLP